MSEYMATPEVVGGHLELDNVPLADHTEVQVIVIPRFDLDRMSFAKVKKLTKSIPGKLSDEVSAQRGKC